MKFLSLACVILFSNGEETGEFYFASRALLYSSYSFPPRSDGSSEFWIGGGDTNTLSFNTTHPSTVLEIDTHVFLDGAHSIRRRLPYLISNPSTRVDHVLEKSRCSAVFKLGYRVAQYYTEFGLPYIVKCATCPPIIHGLPKFYYLLPERDFTQEFAKLRVESRAIRVRVDYCLSDEDCEQNPRVAPFHGFLVDLAAKFAVNRIVINQYISRWSGEQATNSEDRLLQGTPNGELHISNPTIMDSATTSCVMEMGGDELIGSNVFVNTDAVAVMSTSREDGGRTANVFRYEHYEPPMKDQSVKDVDLNLEAFISWREWSCCSACCCPPAICGYEYQTAHDCDNVFSSKTRIGHLSIRKIAKGGRIRSDAFSLALDQLLDLPPYSSEGLPIYSTLLKHAKHDMIFEEIHRKLISKFGRVFKSGVFIESESCKKDAQKLDCTKWAECHGIELEGETSSYLDDSSDSCSQILFQDILAVWRVNMRKPKKYDPNKHCKVQGIIMKNNEILVIGIKRFDLKIDLLLDKNTKARVTFIDKRKKTNVRLVYISAVYWVIAIVVFFALLVGFVACMNREKRRRVQSAFQ